MERRFPIPLFVAWPEGCPDVVTARSSGALESVTVFASLQPDLVDSNNAEAYERAWTAFCRAYEPKIRAWAAGMRLNAGQIDEISGRVMVKLVKTLRTYRYDPSRSFSAWLRAVVTNEVRDFWLSSVRRPGGVGVGGSDARDVLQQFSDVEAATDVLVEELSGGITEREAKVRQAVGEVKGRVQPQTWTAFELVAYQQLGGKEVAARTGLSIAAVHMARSRVAAMIRKELAELGVEY